MKLYLLFAAIALVLGTKAMAGDIKECSKLKLTGRHECVFDGAKLVLNIKKISGVLNVIAETEDERFIVDGTVHARYPFSETLTYTSECSKKALTINSLNNGQSEGTITIKPAGSSIEYTIAKGRSALTLSCSKI
jgi:hypothetical protein